MAVQFEAVCGPKFMTFWSDVWDPCICQRTYPGYLIMYTMFLSKSIGRCRIAKSSKERCFEPPSCRGYTRDSGHALSNLTHFWACGRFWLSSVQRARRVGDETGKKKERSRPEKVAIIAMYCHLRPPDAVAFPT